MDPEPITGRARRREQKLKYQPTSVFHLNADEEKIDASKVI